MSELSSPVTCSVPFLKIDIAEHVPGIIPGRLFRTAWGLEPGLAGAVREPSLIIDLRTQPEKTQREIEVGCGKVLDIPVYQPGVARMLGNMPGRAEYTRNYQALVDGCGAALARVAEAVARSGRTRVVIGCSMGRDRTGVAVGLMLAGIGVPAAVIHAAERSVRGRIAQAVREYPLEVEGMAKEQVLSRLDAAHESLADCLDYCAAGHGSVAGYLSSLGVSPPALAQLRMKLAA